MVSVSQKAETSSFRSSSLMSLPPGFRFDPSNEELVQFYLLSKNNGAPLPSDAIQDFDLYGKMEPWEIWDLHRSGSPDSEDLFFFTQLKRVRSNGSNVMRSVGTGTWFNNRSYSYRLKLEGGGSVRWRLTRFHYEARKEESKKHNRAWLMEELSLEYPMGKHVLCRLRKNARKNNTEQAGSRTRKSTEKRKPDVEERESESESFIHEPKRMKVGEAEAVNVNQVQRLAPGVEVEEVDDDLQVFVEQVNASLEEVSDKEKSTREEDVRQPVPPPGDNNDDDDALNASIDFSELDLDFDYLLSDEFVGATSETSKGNFLFDDGFLNSIPETAGGIHQHPAHSKQRQPSTLIPSH